MVCHNCQVEAKKHGKDRKGNRRFRCVTCSKTFTEPQEKPLGNMYLPVEQAVLVLSLLAEGCSIRSVERLTDVNRNTIMSLRVFVGERCEKLMEERIKNVLVRDVQADELWSFVQCKEKTKTLNGSDDPKKGDAYCFVAIERHTKLVLTWHLGRRTVEDTFAFTEKLDNATAGNFQLSTDGFKPYRDAVVHILGARKISFAQLVKVYGASREGEQRYSPASFVEAGPSPDLRQPGPGVHLHKPCRASESHDQNADATTNPADQWILKEVGKPEGCVRIFLRALQLLQSA